MSDLEQSIKTRIRKRHKTTANQPPKTAPKSPWVKLAYSLLFVAILALFAVYGHYTHQRQLLMENIQQSKADSR